MGDQEPREREVILNATLRESLHARAKSRASLSGRSLKQYVADAIKEIVERDEAEAVEREKERRQKRR